jgi:hypothetical protein
MNDAKYIGLDIHQATISAAVLDSARNLVMEAILETKTETILQFLRGLRRLSCNAGSITVRARSVPGFGRLCWATTNTMLSRVIRVSCASLLVAFVGCGGVF